jgi:phosphoenolpyruvate carboxylase
MLPGWYGAGSGLRAALAKFGLPRLRAACDSWFFLRNLLDDVETMLARSDPEIARYYDELVPPELRRFSGEIRSEFESACEQILAVRGSGALLDSDPTLQRSIQLRSPYLDPISLMQVDLLQRWRAGGRTDRDLFEALLASVAGIAQGLQSTG